MVERKNEILEALRNGLRNPKLWEKKGVRIYADDLDGFLELTADKVVKHGKGKWCAIRDALKAIGIQDSQIASAR